MVEPDSDSFDAVFGKKSTIAIAPVRKKRPSSDKSGSGSGERTRKSSSTLKSSPPLPLLESPPKEVRERSLLDSSPEKERDFPSNSQLIAGTLKLRERAIATGKYHPKTQSKSLSPPIIPIDLPVKPKSIETLEKEIIKVIPPPGRAGDFWGDAIAVKVEKKVAKEPVGVKSKHLASLSNLREKVEIKLGPIEDVEEVEDSEEDRRDYYGTEGETKKRKADALEAMKAKRAAKTPAIVVKPKSDAFAAFREVGASEKKETCVVCNQLVLASTIEKHTEECFEQQSRKTQSKSPAPILIPPPIKKATTFRFAEQNKVIPKPIPVPPKIIEKVPVRKEPSPKRLDKGKGKEKQVLERDMIVLDDEDYFEGDDDDFEYLLAQEAEEIIVKKKVIPPPKPTITKLKPVPLPMKKKVQQIIEIEDDEDEEDYQDDIPLATISSKVNSNYRPGPDENSSPPKGSIYISTLTPALKQGYEHLYLVKEPKGGFDMDAPQKMTPKPVYKPRSGRGRGRGRGRGSYKRK